MNNTIIRASDLHKSYGKKTVLNHLNFDIERGQILGLLGPNGAGKTTLLKALLGLTSYSGTLTVLGQSPKQSRAELMHSVCFIADVAILPKWLKVTQAIEFVQGIHPKFNFDKAMAFLNKTDIPLQTKISTLSKGMITQLHLALVMAIDVELLVLDEPTLGLDIVYRKQFYRSLINDYYHTDRTIIITTHQVEEIEHVLTDVMMINQGELILQQASGTIEERFICVTTTDEHLDTLNQLKPIDQHTRLGQTTLLFENRAAAELSPYGTLSKPSIADIFVAKVQGA